MGGEPGASVRSSKIKPVFIDAFAGCGGLSLGLLKAGWKGLFAIEKDAFAFDTLSTNLTGRAARYTFDWPEWLQIQPWTIESLMEQHASQLAALRGHVDLLAGGPPCQGFSSAGRRRTGDPRNRLFERYLDFVELVRPRLVLIENVRGITYDFGTRNELEERRNFSQELVARLGKKYHVYADTIRCSSFGIPQHRPRFFLVGMLKSEFSQLPEEEDPFTSLHALKARFLKERSLTANVTSYQAISDLEKAKAGVGPSPDTKGYQAILSPRPRSNFQRLMSDGHQGSVTDTRLANHKPHIIERFTNIIAECHASGRLNVQLNREMRERYKLNKMATRVLDPNAPAPTITSMPDDLLHYSEPRTLTVRENARLQTFPDWFVFKGKYTTGGELRARQVPRFTQVANAVPPLIAEMWGEVLIKYAASKMRSRKMAA
jgi:DNA (cytosine-5)-methyltransferase 1